MAFNVGDKVTTSWDDSTVYTVEFGPYQASASAFPRYLVKGETYYSQHVEHDLALAPKFKVGDRVGFENFTDTYEIVYGPFETVGGPGRYLCKSDDGIHRYIHEDIMIPVDELKVGDRVRVVRELSYEPESFGVAGRTGTLLKIDVSDDGLPYKVDLGTGYSEYWVHKVEKI